jgi:acyl phosphate:glycerol-3-phosphate acyltransferase
MPPILGLVLSYLLGSIPSAYLAGRAFRGIDLRQHGSGNLGATNVYRVLGAKIAALVLAADMAKGIIPVLVIPPLTSVAQAPLRLHWAIAYGIAAIAGHVRSAFLLWRGGGKGVATAFGVFLALAPVATLIAFVVWIAVVLAWGFVSLASLAASAVLPIAVALMYGVHDPRFAVCVLVAVFVFWTHRANIGRLRRGEEPRFGRKKPAS